MRPESCQPRESTEAGAVPNGRRLRDPRLPRCSRSPSRHNPASSNQPQVPPSRAAVVVMRHGRRRAARSSALSRALSRVMAGESPEDALSARAGPVSGLGCPGPRLRDSPPELPRRGRHASTPPPHPCTGDMVTLITPVPATRTVRTPLLGRPCRGSGAVPTEFRSESASSRTPAPGSPTRGPLSQPARVGGTALEPNGRSVPAEFPKNPASQMSRSGPSPVFVQVKMIDRRSPPARMMPSSTGGSTRRPDRARGAPGAGSGLPVPTWSPALCGDSAFLYASGELSPSRSRHEAWSKRGVGRD